MRLSPRIAVPVAAALTIAVIIGLTFFWQIQTSISIIENGFGVNTKIPSSLAPTSSLLAPGTWTSQPDALLAQREGELAELRGDWDSAEQLYKKSIAMNGGASALRKLASLQMQRRKFDDAQSTIASLKREEPNNDDTMLLEGLLQLRSGKTGAAQSTFAARPASAQSQYGQALVAISQENAQQAKMLLTQAVQNTQPTIRSSAKLLLDAYNEFALFPDSGPAHLQALLGRSLAQLNECDIALPLVAKAIATEGSYRDAWTVKGYCEFATGQNKEALASLERAYQLDPEKPEIQYFLARVYHALKDNTNAITFLQYAIVNDFEPENDARELLASYALESDNVPLALQQYEALTKKDNSSLTYFQKYVDVALTIPAHGEDGYSMAKKAALKWPDDASSLALLAKAAAATSRLDEAQTMAKSALKIDARNPEALGVLQKLNTTIAPAKR